MDWVSDARISVRMLAVAGEDIPLGGGRTIPRGALVRYREWYGASEPNKGLKLTAEAVARGIKERERNDGIAYGVLDPSAFAESGGPSIAEMMRRIDGNTGPRFRPADNTRIGKLGAASGWMALRARLTGNGEHPMLFVFSTCKALIRTLPLLQHDPDRPEDVDTGMEDHAADEARYACLSRPYVAAKIADPAPPPSVMRGFSDVRRREGVSVLTL
jgi:hypothetical protein